MINSMPNPTRAGYRFVGWHTGGVPVTLPLTVRRDMNIGALWTPIVLERPNPQTSPMQISFMIFGAVMLVALAGFIIMKVTRKQLAAEGQYRANLTRFNREERIVDMVGGGGNKKE